MDLSEMDPARIEEFQAQDHYLQERCPETLVLTYAIHWPGRQRETARGLRRTPFYHAFKANGAVYTEMQGWERPGWFAPEGVAPVHDYAFGKPSWFNHAQTEQKCARNGVVMIDYSMLGKHMVEGQDAENFLQRVFTNDVSMPDGRVTYSLMLNERGGIEGDVTIARHNKTCFMVMSAISHTRRNRDHLQRAILAGEDVIIRDVTSAYAVLALCGPLSRTVLETLVDISLSDWDFPSYSFQQFYIGHAPVFAQRLSFTGEMGWEIFVTPDFAEYVFEQLYQAGQVCDLRLAGGEALNALRIEKGFVHWGSDMAYTESPHQIGLDFACRHDKNTAFIGKAAYLARKAEAKGPFLCSVKLHQPDAMLHHNEPVLRDGAVVGFVTSGAFSALLGTAIGLCLIAPPAGTSGNKELEKGDFTVLVEGRAIPATVQRKAFVS